MAVNQRNVIIAEQKMSLPPKNAIAAEHLLTQKDLKNRSFFYNFLSMGLFCPLTTSIIMSTKLAKFWQIKIFCIFD